MFTAHAREERDRIELEREDAAERFDRFAPRGRDWWQAREEDGLPTLAEEMETQPEATMKLLTTYFCHVCNREGQMVFDTSEQDVPHCTYCSRPVHDIREQVTMRDDPPKESSN